MCLILNSRRRKAVKTHRCIWCGEVINQGDFYQADSVVGEDGDFWYQKYHPECHRDLTDAARIEGHCVYFDPYDNPRPVIEEYVI